MQRRASFLSIARRVVSASRVHSAAARRSPSAADACRRSPCRRISPVTAARLSTSTAPPDGAPHHTDLRVEASSTAPSGSARACRPGRRRGSALPQRAERVEDGAGGFDRTRRLPLERVVGRNHSAPGPEGPHAEASCNDRGHPGREHWNLKAPNLDGQLHHGARSLQHGNDAKERTGDN